MLTLRIIVPLHQGHGISYGVGYCLLFVVGIAEPLMDNIQ